LASIEAIAARRHAAAERLSAVKARLGAMLGVEFPTEPRPSGDEQFDDATRLEAFADFLEMCTTAYRRER
jgi:hypothetical protein